MSTLRIIRVPDATATAPGAAPAALQALLDDWRHVHNEIIAPSPLSADEVRERSARNILDVAYLGTTLVGNMTVRPPAEGSGTATVIARVLPAYRGRGYGTELYERGLATARALGAGTIETVVLTANEAGLRFANARGFTEFERYTVEDEDGSAEYATLRLA